VLGHGQRAQHFQEGEGKIRGQAGFMLRSCFPTRGVLNNHLEHRSISSSPIGVGKVNRTRPGRRGEV
jgi:hypothetical protein